MPGAGAWVYRVGVSGRPLRPPGGCIRPWQHIPNANGNTDGVPRNTTGVRSGRRRVAADLTGTAMHVGPSDGNRLGPYRGFSVPASARGVHNGARQERSPSAKRPPPATTAQRHGSTSSSASRGGQPVRFEVGERRRVGAGPGAGDGRHPVGELQAFDDGDRVQSRAAPGAEGAQG